MNATCQWTGDTVVLTGTPPLCLRPWVQTAILNQLNRAVWAVRQLLPDTTDAAEIVRTGSAITHCAIDVRVLTLSQCRRAPRALQAHAADDGHNSTLGITVRARLCTAIAGVMMHGLRGSALAGGPSLWDLVVRSAREAAERRLADGNTSREVATSAVTVVD